MKLYLSIFILITLTFIVKAQNLESELVIGRWDIQKDPMNKLDLFDSKYSFEFNKDNTFNIIKPVEGKHDSLRIDESGKYKLSKDSIEIIIIQEDGINLTKPQSIKLKIIRLTKTELILQWHNMINQDGKNKYPELKFIKE